MTVVVTVTVRVGPMIGMTVLPAGVGSGAGAGPEPMMIENGPRGIVIPNELGVELGATADSKLISPSDGAAAGS